MVKKSGVDENSQSRFGGGGGLRSLGDAFQPNLAMGGGSYKVPIDLPAGQGGFAPQIELLYDTSAGCGPFGQGWAVSLPFVEQRRPRAFMAEAEPEYSLAGALPLVRTELDDYVAACSQQLQRYTLSGNTWHSRTPNLVEMHFGSSAASRVESVVDGVAKTQRWLVDRMIFPGGREVRIDYLSDGGYLYPATVDWGVFRLQFVYEDRPDPWSRYDSGFEIRLRKRCTRLELHHDRLADSLFRTITLTYEAAPFTGNSMLAAIALTGQRRRNGAMEEASLPPLRFSYTQFSPQERVIERFHARVLPPPGLGDDVTLVDLGGTALPGAFRLNAQGATFWENLGGLAWGAPVSLAALPNGSALSDPGVRFADMEGRGNADLVVGGDNGAGYFPNRPGTGFVRKRSTMLAPSFDLGEEDSLMMDLDGDHVSDLLTFRNGQPIAFFNEAGGQWRGPVVLADSGLPNLSGLGQRVRLADMNGDGQTEVVLLRSREIQYWPYLGNGKWGAPRTMAGSPDFGNAKPERDVLVADINGDGVADLVLIEASQVKLYINRAGEGYAPPIVLPRVTRPAAERVLLADMKGSGTAGLLFTSPQGQGGHMQYWFLDLLNGVKPGLLSRIDNGSGLLTDVEYSSSAFERARDLQEGRRWSGYLPFVVPVVKAMRLHDQVTGEQSATEFRYHDGHFDGVEREYLGFAEVESQRTNGPQEQPLRQRFYYHTRHTTARDPAFIAGRGQPHRTETFDTASGEMLQREQSEWTAQQVAGTAAANPAWLALETTRVSERLYLGATYEREQVEFSYDALGNLTREDRQSTWTDNNASPRIDKLTIENSYASHPLHGLTSFKARIRKFDADGALLKDMRFHYDGAPLIGLPLGQVVNGYRTRQCETALTAREINAAYAGVAPSLLAGLYSTEVDPAFGLLYVRDVGRARVDANGNEIETIDAHGSSSSFEFDGDAMHPVSISENGGPPRAIAFDAIAQQLARIEDLNGHLTVTEFDALGRPRTVYKRGALPGLPTEEYEYRHDSVPNAVIQRIRIEAADAVAGYHKVEYLDGCGRAAQTRMLAEGGTWAVGKQEVFSIQGKRLRVLDAYFAETDAFSATPPADTAASETHYDPLGKVLRERLFNGRWTLHRYAGNVVSFYGPEACEALALDPATPPSRQSVLDAGGQVRAIIEHDRGSRYVQRRDYDALNRLLRIVDPLGNTSLENVYDLWGNRIRIRSSEGGTISFIFDGASHEVQRTDADGRILRSVRDIYGRITELREGASATLIEQYQYDSGPGANLRGRLARVSGDFGQVDYSYTAEGQAREIRRQIRGLADTFVTGFEYDGKRNIKRVTYPDGSVIDYERSTTGLLQRIPGFIDQIEYGPTGLRTKVMFSSGLQSSRRYTPGDYLINEVLTEQAGGGHRYQHLVYELDAVGQATRVDDLSTVPGKVRMNQQFTYDGRNRLVRALGSVAGYDFTYEYDALGNLLRNDEIGTRFEYRNALGDGLAPNRLVRRIASATQEYDYDAAGNLTRDPEMGRLEYDSRHRLVRIERTDGSQVEYVYDHNDRRILTRVLRNGNSETRVEVEGLYLIDNGAASRVVFDEDRRLAIIPADGDALLHHYDRLGNVNVVSNARTGAYVGHDEYTPYGRLFISMVIQPAYTFQGGRFTDGLELVLLGARHYRPALGRFLTCDPWLVENQDKIPPLLGAANLYLFAYANPVNFTDPTGEIAPLLVALIVAAIVGAILGAVGAAVNQAKTWDEWFLWIVGGAIGAVLTVLFWYGILIWAGVAAVTAAVAASIITLGASLLGLFTPLLDASNSEVAWAFSWAIKLIKSPVLTVLGLLVVAGLAADRKRVDFRRGMLFVETGAGTGALTLGAIVYTQSGNFDSSGRVNDNIALHESYHGRTVAALGEFGFYLTYVTFGSIFAAASGGPWNGLDGAGCGNPFESHAYTFFNPNVGGPTMTEVSVSAC